MDFSTFPCVPSFEVFEIIIFEILSVSPDTVFIRNGIVNCM